MRSVRLLGALLRPLPSRPDGPGAAAQADFRSCLSGLRGQAAAQGISGPTFDAATRGRRARPEDPRADGQPARVQDADLGLPRRPRRRGAGPGRPRRHAPMGPGARRGRSALRRRPPRDRRRLGRRVEFRQGHRRPAAGAVADDPRLLRPAPARLLHRRTDGDAQDHRGRRHRRRATCAAPGPAPSGIPSSCPRPSSASRSTSTATAAATSSIPSRTRSARRRTS